MTKLQWTAVAAALGLGILAQIPGHDDAALDGHHHKGMAEHDAGTASMPAAATAAGLETVSLAITGMT